MLTIADRIQILDYDLTPISRKVYQALISFPTFSNKSFGPACMSIIKKPVQVAGQLHIRATLLGEDGGAATPDILAAALFRCMDSHWRNHLNGGSQLVGMESDDGTYATSLFGENLMYGIAVQEWEGELAELFLIAVSVALIKDGTALKNGLDMVHGLLEEEHNPYRPLLVPLLNHARSL
jgi:hypothetical protein